jgi:hypothetical protein
VADVHSSFFCVEIKNKIKNKKIKTMKKIISILTVSVFLFACKKETTTPPVVTPPTGLEASFKFSNNFTDETGKATATSSGTLSFVTDRKGNASSALKLDGGSKLTMSNILQKGKSSSISAWIAYDDLGINSQYFFICVSNGLAFYQDNTHISGIVSVPTTNGVQTGCADMSWHHYAVTFDGMDVKLYKDGVLSGTKSNPGAFTDGNKDFIIGLFGINYWKGRVDDVKFYSKVLSADEVAKLAQE